MKNKPLRLCSRQITLNCSIKGLKKTILFLFQFLFILHFFSFHYTFFFPSFAVFLIWLLHFFLLNSFWLPFTSTQFIRAERKKNWVRAIPFSERSQTQIYPNEKVKKNKKNKVELFPDKDRNKDKEYMEQCRVVQGQTNQKVKIVFN